MTVGAAVLAELVAALEAEPAIAGRLRCVLGLEAHARADDVLDARGSGLSVREFRAAIRRGELRASRVGRRYLVRRADLDAYLASRQVKPRARQALKPKSAAAAAVDRAIARGELRVVGARGVR